MRKIIRIERLCYIIVCAKFKASNAVFFFTFSSEHDDGDIRSCPDPAADLESVDPGQSNIEEHGWQSPHTVVEVVTDDMAFLVDSLSMGLNRTGLTIFLTIHPVVGVVRDKRGTLQSLHDQSVGEGKPTSMICFKIEKQLSADVLRALDGMIREVLQEVIRTNGDWPQMKQQVHAIGDRMGSQKLPIAEDELSEARAFIDWVERDHFTFLAYCEFDIEEEGKGFSLNEESLLGLFKEKRGGNHDPANVIPVLRDHFPQFPCYLIVTKANARSAVHRPAYMDFIGIKRYNDQGELDGLYCIVGLFALTAYSSPPKDIPLLRKKVAEVAERAGLVANSHSGKVLHSILDTFPRDALFQVSSREMAGIALGILGLQERQGTRLFLFKDIFNRFYSCFVYLPREQYNRELRLYAFRKC